MPTDLSELIAISRKIGADPAYVLAGGGNTSLKTDDRLWVKASGHALATIDAGGFVELDRGKLAAMLERAWPKAPAEREAAFKDAVMDARMDAGAGRPSVEALLHHLMPGRLVVHTHPTAINAVTCCDDGRANTAAWFGETVVWQEYVDPGLTLAGSLNRKLGEAAERGVGPDGTCRVLLENHGLIVGAADAAAIARAGAELNMTVIRGLAAVMQGPERPAADPPDTDASIERLSIYRDAAAGVFADSAVVAASGGALPWTVGTPEGKAAALAGPLTPDQIVYCRSVPMWLDKADAQHNGEGLTPEAAAQHLHDAAADYENDHGHGPWVVLIAGAGLLAVRESSKLAGITHEVYADIANVARGAALFGGVQPLSPAARGFIETWEVEAYRRQIAADE